jgi:hypothetical protein
MSHKIFNIITYFDAIGAPINVNAILPVRNFGKNCAWHIAINMNDGDYLSDVVKNCISENDSVNEYVLIRHDRIHSILWNKCVSAREYVSIVMVPEFQLVSKLQN